MTDFDVLTLLLRAKSKDFVLKVCHESLTRNDNTLSEISSVIECSDEETTSLLNSLHSLITNLISQNLTTPTEIPSVFPDDFHKNLATLLTKILVEMLPVWRAKLLENQISLPRLTSFSWSVSTAQQQQSAAVPVCFFHKHAEAQR